MEYLKVKNWHKFQHYKHRSPPWIKLHRSVLSDYAFSCLQDASKAHLILIWLYASDHDGAVPNDPSHLRRSLGLKTNPNLETFIEQGFLILDASNTLAPRKQDADSEERREEREGQKPVDNLNSTEAREKLKVITKRIPTSKTGAKTPHQIEEEKAALRVALQAKGVEIP